MLITTHRQEYILKIGNGAGTEESLGMLVSHGSLGLSRDGHEPACHHIVLTEFLPPLQGPGLMEAKCSPWI